MKITLKIILIICCSAISYGVSATNYVGIDYKFRSMKGKRTNTYSMRQVLPKSYTSGEVYFTHRFSNNVGLNLGVEQSQNKARNYTFSANELFLGDTQNAGDRTSTKTRIKALHLDVCGFFSQTSRFELLGQLGLALMQAKITGTITSSNITRDMNPSDSYKFVPRIGFGMQYFLGQNIGLRTMFNWEGTSMYRVKLTDEDGIRRKIKAFKQSWCLAFGIVGRF